MISNNIKENNKAINVKDKKTNNIKENHKSISVKKTKNLIELIEIIEQIKKQQNKDKIINKEKLPKEKKDLEKVSEVNNKHAIRGWKKDYISLIQNIIYQQLNSGFKFDYNDYIVNHENKTFSQVPVGFNTLSKEIKYYDSPVLDNHKVDDIMQKIKFGEIKGQVNGDYFIPENVAPDDFERFYYFKKLNPTLIMLKYELKSR